MPNSNSNLYLGLIAFVFVVAIAWCLWPCGSTKADRDPVMLDEGKRASRTGTSRCKETLERFLRERSWLYGKYGPQRHGRSFQAEHDH